MAKKTYLKQDEETIAKIHAVLIVLAKELKRICEKHNLHYFMLSGTLLGAVRHKGFIPWDDDMDFGLIRDDYDKFLEICKTELDDEKFFLQTQETDPGYGKFYTRIVLKNTFLNNYFIINSNQIKGFFIDIFPYDNVPKSKILQKKQCILLTFANRLVKKKMGYVIKPSTKIIKMQLKLEKFFSLNFLKKLYKKQQIKYNKKETKYVTCHNGGNGYVRETLQKRWLLETVPMQFEDISLPGLKEYDEYLTYMYGNYMELPPEEKRVTHRFTDVDFGPYDNILEK